MFVGVTRDELIRNKQMAHVVVIALSLVFEMDVALVFHWFQFGDVGFHWLISIAVHDGLLRYVIRFLVCVDVVAHLCCSCLFRMMCCCCNDFHLLPLVFHVFECGASAFVLLFVDIVSSRSFRLLLCVSVRFVAVLLR